MNQFLYSFPWQKQLKVVRVRTTQSLTYIPSWRGHMAARMVLDVAADNGAAGPTAIYHETEKYWYWGNWSSSVKSLWTHLQKRCPMEYPLEDSKSSQFDIDNWSPHSNTKLSRRCLSVCALQSYTGGEKHFITFCTMLIPLILFLWYHAFFPAIFVIF